MHIVQRGHNRQRCFFDDRDYVEYLATLIAALQAIRCSLLAYVLMTNHTHLLLTPSDATAFPRVIMALGRRYGRHVNRTYGRSGTLWEGRYYSSVVTTFTGLGMDEADRRAAYRRLFETELDGETPDEIRRSLNQCNAAEITEGVIGGRLHCGFLRVPVSRPAGLVHETLLVEPVVVAMPLDHRLARQIAAPATSGASPRDAEARARRSRATKRTGAMTQRGVTLHDLHEENVILVRRPGAPGLYANLLALCEARGVRINVVAEVERMMTSLNLVAAGAGISVVPASMQGAHPRALAFRPFVSSVKLDAPLTLVYRDGEEAGPTMRFVELARTMAAQWRDRGPPQR